MNDAVIEPSPTRRRSTFGMPIGQDEGIGEAGGSQKQRQPLIADVSENATDHRDDADDGGRFENLPLMGHDLGQKIEAPSLSL